MEIERITIAEADNEKYLRQISKEVDFNDKSYLDDINKLEMFCVNNEVFAMAAVQIGIPKRIVYLKNTSEDVNKNEDPSYNEAKVLINPKLVKIEGETEYWEACASCLDYMGLIKRPYRMVVKYQGVDGKRHVKTFKGFEATVMSHELDHLDGVLHIDIASEIIEMPKEERTEWRKEHPYKIISRD